MSLYALCWLQMNLFDFMGRHPTGRQRLKTVILSLYRAHVPHDEHKGKLSCDVSLGAVMILIRLASEFIESPDSTNAITG